MTPRAELTQKTWPVKRKPQLDVCFGGGGRCEKERGAGAHDEMDNWAA